MGAFTPIPPVLFMKARPPVALARLGTAPFIEILPVWLVSPNFTCPDVVIADISETLNCSVPPPAAAIVMLRVGVAGRICTALVAALIEPVRLRSLTLSVTAPPALMAPASVLATPCAVMSTAPDVVKPTMLISLLLVTVKLEIPLASADNVTLPAVPPSRVTWLPPPESVLPN